MKTRDSGGLPCPDCGSPLVPCKCDRKWKVGRFGSTLKTDPKKKLRARTLAERAEENPLRYGPVFLKVREKPCAGRVYLPGHECGLGYAPASAHHIGKDDLDGLVPACAAFHDQMEEREAEVSKALREAGSPSLKAIGRSYVGEALFRLEEAGELAPEIMAAARRRGLMGGVQK